MRIIFLGTGWPVPNPDRVGSSQLVEIAGRYHLIDCGNNATTQMVRAGVSPLAVNRVFFTHLHYDHVADFPYFVLSGWLCNRQERIRLWGPRGTARFSGMLFENGAYAADIESRLLYPFKRANKVAIEVDARDVGAGPVFDEDGVRVTAAFVEHIAGEISPCLAFRVEAEGRAVVFSGDTAPCQAVVDLARGADLLVHECCFPQAVADARRTSGVGHWQHTGPVDLGKIARDAGVPRLVMTHLGPVETTNETLIDLVAPHLGRQNIGPGMLARMVEDVRGSYAGEIVVAEDLSVVEV